MSLDLAEKIAAVIDPPAWSDRDQLRANGHTVLRETERTKKMDRQRRATSLRKARNILRTVATHFEAMSGPADD